MRRVIITRREYPQEGPATYDVLQCIREGVEEDTQDRISSQFQYWADE